MEESYGVDSPFFMGLFPNALGCFLTSQKIRDNEYHLFKTLNRAQRLLIFIEFINTDYKNAVASYLEVFESSEDRDLDDGVSKQISFYRNVSIPAIRYYSTYGTLGDNLKKEVIACGKNPCRIEALLREKENACVDDLSFDDIPFDDCFIDCNSSGLCDEGNTCVLPGKERVRELFGEKLDLNGHLHYSIDVEEGHGVEGVKGLSFEPIDGRESNLVLCLMNNGLSKKAVGDIDRAIRRLGYNVPLEEVYDRVYHDVLHKSPLASLAVPLKFCKKCKEMKITKRVFCPVCGWPFIKGCDTCSITEAVINQIVKRHEAVTCPLECNCPDCIPNNTIIINTISWEGFICQLHMFGYTERMVAITPSTQLLLSEYCNHTDSFSSVTDKNSACLWKHIGKTVVSDRMEQLHNHSVDIHADDPLRSFLPNEEEVPEELVFGIKSRLELENKIRDKSLSLEVVKSSLSQLILDLKSFKESISIDELPIVAGKCLFIDSENSVDRLSSLYDDMCEQCQLSYDRIGRVFRSNGLIDSLSLLEKRYNDLMYVIPYFGGSIPKHQVSSLSSLFYDANIIHHQNTMVLELMHLKDTVTAALCLGLLMKQTCQQYIEEVQSMSTTELMEEVRVRSITAFKLTAQYFKEEISILVKKCSAAVTSMKIDEDIEGCKELMCCIQYNMNYLSRNLKLSFTVHALCRLCDRMNNCTIQVKDIGITRYPRFSFVEDYSVDSLLVLFKNTNAIDVTAIENSVVEENDVCGEDSTVVIPVSNVSATGNEEDEEILESVCEMIREKNGDSESGEEESEVSSESGDDECDGEGKCDDSGKGIMAPQQENQLRRSTRTIRINSRVSNAHSFPEYLKLTKKVSRKRGPAPIKKSFTESHIHKEKKRVDGERISVLRKSCRSGLLLSELMKRKIDGSLLNSQKRTEDVLRYNTEEGTTTADCISSHSSYGIIKQYAPGMKRLGEHYKEHVLQSDCHCEEGSNVSVFLPRVDTVRECVDSEPGQKSCTDSLDNVSEVRQYLPREVLDHSVGYLARPKGILFSKERPSGCDKALVRLITFNLYTDGVEVFNSTDHGTVYAITLIVNNALDKLRNTPVHTCRIATIPSSTGSKSNPIFRSCLGLIIKAINEDGKDGFYIKDLSNNLFYHYYYGIHCYCGDLIAAMQLFDRPSCGSSNVPCFQYNCAAGVYNPVLNRYCYPENNLSAGTTDMKSIGRFLTQFSRSSIYRAAPLIACYSSDINYPPSLHPNKDQQIIDIVEKFMGIQLSHNDKVCVVSLFFFFKSLSNDMFLHTPIESGIEEKREADRVVDPDGASVYERTNLVNVKESTPLDPQSIFGFDFMHGVSNAISKTMSYILGRYTMKEDITLTLKEEVLKNWSDADCSHLLPYWYTVPDSVVVEAGNYIDKENKLKKDTLVKKENILISNNFKHLRCYDRMTFAFQVFPSVFGHALHIPTVRLFSYAFQIIADFYNINSNWKRAYELQQQLLIVLGCIEGLVRDRFMTISFHMFSHLFSMLDYCGPFKNFDTFYTERSYQVYDNVKINSRNVIKTLGMRILFVTYSSIANYYSNLESDYKLLASKDRNEQTSVIIIWGDLFRDNKKLLKYLTYLNFEDDVVYSRCDVVRFQTALDWIINHGFHIDGTVLPIGVYLENEFWKTMVFNNTVYSRVFYEDEYYYSYNYEKPWTIDDFVVNKQVMAYLRGFNGELRLFVMLGFIKVKVGEHDYVQAICYCLPTIKPLSVNTPLIVTVKKSDLITLNKKRLCLVSCRRLTHNRGRFTSVSKEDYILFRTGSNLVCQSRVMKYSPLFDSINMLRD